MDQSMKFPLIEARVIVLLKTLNGKLICGSTYVATSYVYNVLYTYVYYTSICTCPVVQVQLSKCMLCMVETTLQWP